VAGKQSDEVVVQAKPVGKARGNLLDCFVATKCFPLQFRKSRNYTQGPSSQSQVDGSAVAMTDCDTPAINYISLLKKVK